MNTFTTQTSGNITLESIQEVKKLLVDVDPIVKFMREKGFDPDEGCLMIVPSVWRDKWQVHRKYIKYSDVIDQPIMINPNFTFPEFNWEIKK